MGPGLFFEQETARFEVNQSTIVNNADGVARKTAIEFGDVVLLELVGTSYEKVTLPSDASAQLPSQLVGVALESANHGETVRVGLRGEFQCKCHSAVDLGDECVVRFAGTNNFGTLGDPADTPAANPAVYHKLVGVAQKTATADSPIVTVFFDGITGIMGTHN
jgi:hypothetical protein